MKDIPKTEAEGLFAQPLHCQDVECWCPVTVLAGTFQIEAGLLDENDVRTNLQVYLQYRNSMKTVRKTYIFTVFRKQQWGLERAYQLEVSQGKAMPKDPHSLPHEHMGAERTTGGSEWSDWSFEEVLQHFCSRTRIAFVPPINHPEYFCLKG